MFIGLFFRTATTILMLSLLACGGSGPGGGTPTGTLAVIILSPASGVLTLGATTTLAATGTCSGAAPEMFQPWSPG